MESQALPVSPSSEEWRQLLEDTLGKEDGAAVAASPGCREVVINVNSSPDDNDPPSGPMSEERDLATQKAGATTTTIEVRTLQHLHAYSQAGVGSGENASIVAPLATTTNLVTQYVQYLQ